MTLLPDLAIRVAVILLLFLIEVYHQDDLVGVNFKSHCCQHSSHPFTSTPVRKQVIRTLRYEKEKKVFLRNDQNNMQNAFLGSATMAHIVS